MVTWVLARREEPLTPQERTEMLATLRHFDGDRYDLHAAVVMDDHVHLLVTPLPGYELSRLVHTWKSFSAHQMVRGGRSFPVWRDEYMDTIIRRGPHMGSAIAYVRDNPAKRWTGMKDYDWLYLGPASGRQLE